MNQLTKTSFWEASLGDKRSPGTGKSIKLHRAEYICFEFNSSSSSLNCPLLCLVVTTLRSTSTTAASVPTTRTRTRTTTTMTRTTHCGWILLRHLTMPSLNHCRMLLWIYGLPFLSFPRATITSSEVLYRRRRRRTYLEDAVPTCGD